jgi:predicted GIY-YIG superfamily endonuclease
MFLCFRLFNGTVLQAKTTHSCYELACKGWLRSPYLKELLHYYKSVFFYSCAISVEMHLKAYVKEQKLFISEVNERIETETTFITK